MSTQIKNSVAVISKFDRSIKFDLVRIGTKKFGHVCTQTGKRLTQATFATRLEAAVNLAGTYNTTHSHADCGYVNAKSVAHIAGLASALDFLVAAGLVKIDHSSPSDPTAVVIEVYNPEKNS